MIYPDVFPMLSVPRISPPTWALTVEMLFYLLIAVGLSRTRGRTILWLIISSIYTVGTHFFENSNNLRYAALASGSFPFALGSCIYHWRGVLLVKFSTILGSRKIPLLVCVFLLNCLLGSLVLLLGLASELGYTFFYASFIINVFLLFSS